MSNERAGFIAVHSGNPAVYLSEAVRGEQPGDKRAVRVLGNLGNREFALAFVDPEEHAEDGDVRAVSGGGGDNFNCSPLVSALLSPFHTEIGVRYKFGAVYRERDDTVLIDGAKCQRASDGAKFMPVNAP